MKLTIKSGESVDNALKYLQDFLTQYKEEYPMLMGNMNVYISLKGFGDCVCPENDENHILTGSGAVDVERVRKEEAKKVTLEGWKAYVRFEMLRPTKIEECIQREIDYLKSAEKKGRKPQTIEQHKSRLEELRTALPAAEEMNVLIKKLDEYVESEKYYWTFQKYATKNQPYNYMFYATMIFDDVDGYYSQFKGYRHKHGCFGSLTDFFFDDSGKE